MNKRFIHILIAAILPFLASFQSIQYQSIKSDQLALSVDANFPSIIQYKLLKNNAILKGSISNNKTLLINGIEFQPKVTSTVKDNAILYTMSIEDIEVSLTVKVEVIDNIVELKFIEVIENGAFKINTIAFPEHQLLTVSSKVKNANFSGAKMFTAVGGNDGEI